VGQTKPREGAKRGKRNWGSVKKWGTGNGIAVACLLWDRILVLPRGKREPLGRLLSSVTEKVTKQALGDPAKARKN